MTAAVAAAVRGANIPTMHAALDALTCLPADNNVNDNFVGAGGAGGGGGGGGRGTGGRMIIDHGSVRAAIKKDR